MGQVIEKEKNRDSDENSEADGLKTYNKKRKKNKSQPDVNVIDIGDICKSSNVEEEDLNLDFEKDKQFKASSSRRNRKVPSKEEASVSTSCEELEEVEREFLADPKHGQYDEERKSKEKRAEKTNLLEKERKGDHTRSKGDICCCCVRVVKDFDGVQDEKEEEMEGDQEKLIHDENIVEGEEASHRNEEEISIQRDEGSDVSNTRYPGSPLGIRKVHERKIRFQSSRPTSLETILEDVVASPFFFQDSIIKSLDGREDHRGVREGSNLFQVVQEEEEEKRDELESEEEGGDDFWRTGNINRMKGSGKLISEEDFNILPLWNSRIFQGVIENLNYLLDNNESDAVPSTTSSCSSSREFLEYPFKRSGSLSSSSSSKCEGGVESEIIDNEFDYLSAGEFRKSNYPPGPRRQSEKSQEPVSEMNQFGPSALVHESRETNKLMDFRPAKQKEKSEDKRIDKTARNSRFLEMLKPEDNLLNASESEKVKSIEMAPLRLPHESALSKPIESKFEPERKVSFTIYIQYEKVISELTPKDTENKYGSEATHSNNPEEGQLALATASSESFEECNYMEIQESLGKGYQLKLLQAIQSLDSLNDQIVEFIFSGAEFEEEHGGSPKQREALKSSMSLMRRLLVDAQSKFRKMVEDNKQLASRIDGELQTAHQEVNLLRQELADTNRRITQIQEHNNHHNMDDLHHRADDGGMMSEGPTQRPDTPTTNTTINGPSKYHSESSTNQLAEEMSQLRMENEKLTAKNRSLQREVEELRRVKESMVEEDLQLKPQMNQMTMELTHAKEALSALKADRKRLKAEKFDLLNQMKQLYATLEDKEKELRDFIRNYEQRMKESDESLRHLAAERDETEREKWNILKHARDESEKVVKLSAQLGLKEAAIKKLQDDLDMVRKQLTSVGYYSDAESVRTNGLPTPTASTPTCSPQPVSTTPTPTPNGRGSSADSGVRLSSDRDSTASHDGGVGTPKESPSLSPLYATPSSMKGEDRGGDSTPTGGPGTTGHSLNSSAMSGLASSNASTGGLSRSAEQLCERLAEASEASKGRGGGSSTLSRKGNKSGGTWGSISRVFARQKKRAALDASLYDGSGSDKRASWSPSSSLCVSPLTEESYSEKLRLLEEAQHIPLERWKAPTVLAWLEVTLGMPQYGAMCAENVRSGKVLLELNDSELEAGLGISHPMHRKKLRLAIEELREPRLSRFPRISALGHTWVSSEWLPDLGLPQYCDAFANNLVDGRLLEALTKKELEKHLGVHRKFHQASIIHGVHLLRIVRFDRQILAERRRQSENVDCDPLVWTNIRWVKWARTIDLAEYADNLKDSGVHGALVVLESSFTCDTMATALGIPQSKNIIRRHLATELESLVNPARQQLDEQARFAKLERRRQEKLAAGGSLGRSFSRSYGTGLEKSEKDKRRASLRGSLSRALGLRVREEINAIGNGGESSSSGGQSPAVSSRAHPHHPPQARPRSSVVSSGVYMHHETHRRVKSIGDIETITVTPV